MAKYSKTMLENVGAKIIGVVMTKVTRNAGGKYYYYKYSNYDKYYYSNES